MIYTILLDKGVCGRIYLRPFEGTGEGNLPLTRNNFM